MTCRNLGNDTTVRHRWFVILRRCGGLNFHVFAQLRLAVAAKRVLPARIPERAGVTLVSAERVPGETGVLGTQLR